MSNALRRMTGRAVLAAALLMSGNMGAQAAKRQIEIRNNTPNTIYRVNAWVSDFLPNALNLMPIALRPNERRVIEISDDYNKCLFVIIVDFRNPRQRFDPRRPVRKPINPKWYQDINLCVADPSRPTKVLDVKP